MHTVQHMLCDVNEPVVLKDSGEMYPCWLSSCVCLQGDVQIFDLGRRSLKAAATIKQGAADQAATCLAFNCQNPHLLAVGKTDGTVGVWHLSADLTEQSPRESSQLEQIANQVAGWDKSPLDGLGGFVWFMWTVLFQSLTTQRLEFRCESEIKTTESRLPVLTSSVYLSTLQLFRYCYNIIVTIRFFNSTKAQARTAKTITFRCRQIHYAIMRSTQS